MSKDQEYDGQRYYCEVRCCGEQCCRPAVDYYWGDNGDGTVSKFWLCQKHWDEHAQICLNLKCGDPHFDAAAKDYEVAE